MRKSYLYYFAITLTILVSACVGCRTGWNTSLDIPLFQCWSNSFEEESHDSIRIFRPCATYSFPSARYRNTFTLKENGEAEYSVLAPNDAHTMKNGRWLWEQQTRTLKILNKEDEIVSEYVFVWASKDILKLKG